MFFPSISDLLIKDIVIIDASKTLADAIELMLNNNHRNAVVCDSHKQYIITASDFIKFNLKHNDMNTKLHDLNIRELPLIDKDRNILETLDMLKENIEYIGVVNREGDFVGLLTHTDIMSSIDPHVLMENFTLSDFIKISKRVQWVTKDNLTSDILKQMTNETYSSVVVIENKKPIGIITTKDAMRIFKEKRDLSLSVSHYMVSPVITIDESASLKDAIVFMQSYQFKRIVVVNSEGEVLSIITQKELISLTYSKWASLMKNYQDELKELNQLLESENEKYERLASIDPLTKLYNRQKFYELFISEYKVQKQRDNKMSLLMLDIDYFKKINDTFGHNIGDKVLIEISNILKQTLRNVDIICRWGGEEFVVLLPTATINDTQKIAESLRTKIENSNIIQNYTITSSFGITTILNNDSIEKSVDRADKALYISKKSGRNCVNIIV